MHLVEIFLPISEPAGKLIPRQAFADTRRELLSRFGGLTSYSRTPGKGFWKRAGAIVRDDVVVFEMLLSKLDRK